MRRSDLINQVGWRGVRGLRGLREQRGTSIVIALGLIAAMLFFTIGISSTVITTINNTSHSKKAVQAEYAAQGGIEMVYKQLAGMESAEGDGVEGILFMKDACEGVVGDCESEGGASIYAKYEIVGQDEDSETKYDLGYRSVPVLGTGDAILGCDSFDYDKSELQGDAGHVCNWNRLYYGKSVDIPLYVVDVTGEEVWNLAADFHPGDGSFDGSGIGISYLEIRFRAPCKVFGTDGFLCAESGEVDGEGVTDDVVVNWQVSGTCFADDDSGEICAFLQNPEAGDSGSVVSIDRFPGSEDVPVAFLDPVTEGMDMSENVVSGTDILEDDEWLMNRPVLKLSFVREIVNTDGDTIPYLEYQLIYDSTKPLASAYTVSVEGYAESFRYSLKGIQSVGAGLFDFAVQN